MKLVTYHDITNEISDIQSTLCITNEFGPGVLFAIESVRYIESYQPCLGPLVDNERLCLEQNILNEYLLV